MTTTGKPTTTKTTTSKTAAFLARAIGFSGKRQSEIARESGFPKPNVLSMMRRGQMKIPIDRVAALAAATHVDPAYFLRLVLEEYHPTVYAVLINTIGEPLTKNEWEMVLAYRLVAPENQLEMTPMVTTAILDTLLEFRKDLDDEP